MCYFKSEYADVNVGALIRPNHVAIIMFILS